MKKNKLKSRKLWVTLLMGALTAWRPELAGTLAILAGTYNVGQGIADHKPND